MSKNKGYTVTFDKNKLKANLIMLGFKYVSDDVLSNNTIDIVTASYIESKCNVSFGDVTKGGMTCHYISYEKAYNKILELI